jgi:hypothetical protein
VTPYLEMGFSLERAAREAMTELGRLTVPFPSRMNLVAVDARRRHLRHDHRDRCQPARTT